MKDIKNIKISHRGIHNNQDIPENSLKAFKQSIKENIPIELDVHMLKDKSIVVFHDDNIKRMTNIDKDIHELTYDELKNYKLLNTNETIPLLKDVLKLVNGKVLLNIEVKYQEEYIEECRQLSKILDNYKGSFLIQSFSIKIVHWFKKHKKNYITGLLISNKVNIKNKFIILAIKILKPDFVSLNKKLHDKEIIKYLKKKNIPILLWTIKKDEISKYKNKNFGLIYE